MALAITTVNFAQKIRFDLPQSLNVIDLAQSVLDALQNLLVLPFLHVARNVHSRPSLSRPIFDALTTAVLTVIVITIVNTTLDCSSLEPVH